MHTLKKIQAKSKEDSKYKKKDIADQVKYACFLAQIVVHFCILA